MDGNRAGQGRGAPPHAPPLRGLSYPLHTPIPVYDEAWRGFPVMRQGNEIPAPFIYLFIYFLSWFNIVIFNSLETKGLNSKCLIINENNARKWFYRSTLQPGSIFLGLKRKKKKEEEAFSSCKEFLVWHIMYIGEGRGRKINPNWTLIRFYLWI